MVSKKKKMVEEVGKEVVMPEVEVKQQGIEAMALIEVVISSVEATTHMGSAQPMLEGLGDIDKLLENVSLTLQQCQTPTKTSSTITTLKPTQEQLQVNIDGTISNLQAAQEKRNQATSQEAEHEQRVSRLHAHQLDLQAKASEL
uniref:Uncharacterized protein n=1 Tax=Fagus sylvatica TaxID=28930 RepID=A0A2N9EGB3_FAGSY